MGQGWPSLRCISFPRRRRISRGRGNELAELRAAIEQGGATISGLQGQGGVGKTALALVLAQQLTPKYPDAQIYIDLRGVSQKPLTAAEAMASVVRAFQPEAKLPESETDLKPIYLSVLNGKRALLVMDNARDAAQVAPLVPPAGSALIVTSGFHFVVPGLHAKNLDTLPPADARDLLLAIACGGVVAPGFSPAHAGLKAGATSRFQDITAHAAEIARLCGYLPLALRLAATALAERVDLSPADYRQRLEKQRLKLLEAKGLDPSVEASIGLSYGLLDPETQERWRMLAVFPETFYAAAAAAVWAIEGEAGQDVLSRLVQYSLLEWDDPNKRYRLHDLVRDFARSQLEPAERGTAERRHARHYASMLRAADDLYLKGGESIKSGLALFDVEWGNIQAGQAWAAARAGQDDEAARVCSDYPGAGYLLLDLRQHPRERIQWREAALAAARRLGLRSFEGAHLGNLGLAYDSLGEYRRAIEYHEQHLAIVREIGDRQGEGQALGNLGIAYYSLGEYRRAIEYHEQRLAIATEIGDRRGEGKALGNLGIAYYSLGEYRRAIEYHEQALDIDREIGDRLGQGQDLGNLGIAYYSLGEYRRAIEYHEQALNIDREIGDRRGEGQDLGNLGIAYYSLGEYRRAIEYHEQRLAIAREIGDRLGEGNALGNLGNAYDSLGEYRRAREYYGQQLAIATGIGDREGEGTALWNMSLALDKLGQRAEAIIRAQEALGIFEKIESPLADRARKRLEQWRK